MDRRRLLRGAPALLAAAAAGPSRGADDGPRPNVLRTAVRTAETGFDPLQIGDTVSIEIGAQIFEPLLGYDPLARPARLVPLTAAALPEVSADFRHFVFTLRPGILFDDHPAFGGRPRELVAADYVYSLKRLYDPALRTEHLYRLEGEQILGLSELRERALKSKTPFPYDTEVEGLRATGRYRLELRLARPAPRFVQVFSAHFTAAVAREVVEQHADDINSHPVGTGPFRLAQWRRASRIVLERNPRFREQRYEAQPAADDAAGQSLARQLRGRRLPMLERIEIDVIEEAQPRWLAFLGGQHDILEVPPSFAPLALPGGTLAPFLRRQGVQLQRTLQAATTHTYFNLDDPLVGGLAPERVALRRAIALAYDSALQIRLVLNGEAEPAQSLIPPQCYGHDPALRSEMGQASLPRAAALLDLYGYVDRDGDGWREQPDGARLRLRLASGTTQVARQSNELWRKRLNAVGLDIEFEAAPFGQLIRRALAGQLMMWGFSWTAPGPDGDFYLGLGYGPNAGQSNDARFRLPAFDRLYERQRALPDGAERLALMRDATRTMLAYVPYIAHHHPYVADLTRPQVLGYRRHPFADLAWRYTAVDTTAAPA